MTFPDRDISPLSGALEHTLRSGRLAPEHSDWGSRLLLRLSQPVQVAVIGREGAGKSAVIDMLLGRVVIGRHGGGAVIDVAYGPEETVQFENAAGQQRQRRGVLAAAAAPKGTVRVRQRLPGPRLSHCAFTEMTLDGSAEQQAALLNETAGFSDIILWCSGSFDPEEQALWSAVPDSRKDHSFLVLTKADRQIMRGTLAGLLETLDPVAAEEFLGVYPVAAIQGLTAQTAGAAVNADLWRSSGGKRLCEDILHQAELGRASDVDQAELFVRQFGRRDRASPPPAAAVTRQPADSPAPGQAALGGGGLLRPALDLLQKRADEMLAGDGTQDAAGVLSKCMETVRELSETLLAAPGGSPLLKAAQEAAQDGEELLILLQLEQDEDAAVDAVTLLLQLKKELAEAPGG